MARSWTVPTLASRVEQFCKERALDDASTIADLRQQFKDAVWEAAIAPAKPAKSTPKKG